MRPTLEQVRQKVTDFQVEYVQDAAANPAVASAALAAGRQAYSDNPVLDQPWPLTYRWGSEDWWLWWIGVFRAAGVVP